MYLTGRWLSYLTITLQRKPECYCTKVYLWILGCISVIYRRYKANGQTLPDGARIYVRQSYHTIRVFLIIFLPFKRWASKIWKLFKWVLFLNVIFILFSFFQLLYSTCVSYDVWTAFASTHKNSNTHICTFHQRIYTLVRNDLVSSCSEGGLNKSQLSPHKNDQVSWKRKCEQIRKKQK